MFLVNNGNSPSSGMSEKQQNLFQVILSALAANEETTGSGLLSGLNENGINGDQLLNSYPPKKRHRMQMTNMKQKLFANGDSAEDNNSNNNNGHNYLPSASHQEHQLSQHVESTER